MFLQSTIESPNSDQVRLGYVMIGFAAVAVIMLPAAIWEGMRLESEYQEVMNEWRLQVTIWNRLFYCARCDQIFNPHTSRTVPPAQMHVLLT